MPAIRAQVILHTADAVPENYVTNSLCFLADDPIAAPTALTPLIKTFYDLFRGYLSPVITQNGHEIKWTALPGVAPNYPYETTTWDFATPLSGTALPDEVASVLSFQGTKEAGFPQARRRGRIYIGPLATVAANANRPATLFQTALGTAASGLKDDSNDLGVDAPWAIWSQVDGAAVIVDNGWIDNAFDTQRRRGVRTTSRAIWS